MDASHGWFGRPLRIARRCVQIRRVKAVKTTAKAFDTPSEHEVPQRLEAVGAWVTLPPVQRSQHLAVRGRGCQKWRFGTEIEDAKEPNPRKGP